MHFAPLPEISKHLFAFTYIEGETVVGAPFIEEFHLLSLLLHVVIINEVHYCCIISKLHDGVGVVLGNAGW